MRTRVNGKLTRYTNKIRIDEITDEALKDFASDNGIYIQQAHRIALIKFAEDYLKERELTATSSQCRPVSDR